MFLKALFIALLVSGYSYAEPTLEPGDVPEGEVETNYWNGNAVLRMKDGTVYVVPAPKLTPEMQHQLDQMTQEEFLQFCAKREAFLQSWGRLLHFRSRLRFGMGTMLKDKLYQILPKLRRSEVNQHPIEFLVDVTSQETLPVSEKMKKSIEKTKEILRLVDYQLWQSPLVVARKNEFGVAVFAGGGAGLMVRSSDKGFFGSIGIGISIGYNVDAKALVINVFKNVDRALRAFTVVAPTIPTKAQVYFATRDWISGGPGITAGRGRGAYPPGPFDVQFLPGAVYFGFSPPSLDTIYGYEGNTRQYSIINIAISRLFPGFIKVGSTADEIFSDGYYTVQNVAEKILSYFMPSRVLTCRGLFL